MSKHPLNLTKNDLKVPSHDAIFGYARQIISPNQLIKGLIIVAIISDLELQSKHPITLTKNDF